MKTSGSQQRKSSNPQNGMNRVSTNPFEEFEVFAPEKSEIPLDQIVQSTEIVMDRIRWGYEKLLEEEAKELVWMVQYNTIIKAYEVAEKYVKEIDYAAEDIEDFCFALENTQRIPYLIPGPAGIYISALCNYTKEEEIALKLSELKTEINLIAI